MVRFGQPVFDFICRADHVEAHGPRIDCVPVAGLLSELDAIVGENGVYFVRNGFQQVLKKLPCCLAVCFVDQLGHGELAGAINGHEQMQLTLFGSDLRDINVEIANRVALELLPFRLVTVNIWKTRDAMPLKTTMQRRTGQVWDRRL